MKHRYEGRAHIEGRTLYTYIHTIKSHSASRAVLTCFNMNISIGMLYARIVRDMYTLYNVHVLRVRFQQRWQLDSVATLPLLFRFAMHIN